jgi:hypothetical protein
VLSKKTLDLEFGVSDVPPSRRVTMAFSVPAHTRVVVFEGDLLMRLPALGGAKPVVAVPGTMAVSAFPL